MNYEIAKQLKDAGFTFREEMSGQGNCYYCGRPGIEIDGTQYYIPNDSELIDAFDTVFLDIEKLKDGWGCNDHYYRENGKTLEEALTNLWLTLYAPRKERVSKRS